MITRDVKVGDWIQYTDFDGIVRPAWQVRKVSGGIAYETAQRNESTQCFIYRFADGEFNRMHTIVEAPNESE